MKRSPRRRVQTRQGGTRSQAASLRRQAGAHSAGGEGALSTVWQAYGFNDMNLPQTSCRSSL